MKPVAKCEGKNQFSGNQSSQLQISFSQNFESFSGVTVALSSNPIGSLDTASKEGLRIWYLYSKNHVLKQGGAGRENIGVAITN